MLTLNGSEDVSTVVMISLSRNCLVWFLRKKVPRHSDDKIAIVQANFPIMESLL